VDEGPGGSHYDDIFSKNYARIGVGIVTVNGAMFFSIDLAP